MINLESYAEPSLSWAFLIIILILHAKILRNLIVIPLSARNKRHRTTVIKMPKRFKNGA